MQARIIKGQLKLRNPMSVSIRVTHIVYASLFSSIIFSSSLLVRFCCSINLVIPNNLFIHLISVILKRCVYIFASNNKNYYFSFAIDLSLSLANLRTM